MDEQGVQKCTPTLSAEELSMTKRPYVDDFSSGYMQRVMHLFPKQGDQEPWVAPQNYRQDKKLMRRSPIDDGVLRFAKADVQVGQMVGELHAAD